MAGENYGGDGGGAIGAMMQVAMPFAQHQFNNDLMQRQSRINMKNSMLMGEYNMANAYKFWEATGPKAQLRLQKEAGLSPGLMQSKGAGPGGQLQGQGNPAPGSYGNIMMPNMVETMLAGAQIDALKAKAEKDRADANKASGVDTQEAESRIDAIAAGIKETEARTKLTEFNAQIREIDLELEQNEDYNSARWQEMLAKGEKALYDAESALYKSQVDRETKDTAIETAKATLASIYIEQDLKKAGIKKTHAEIDKIAAEMTKWTIELQNAGKQIDLNELKIKIDALLGGINALGNIISVSKLAEILKNKKGTTSETEHWGKHGEFKGATIRRSR